MSETNGFERNGHVARRPSPTRRQRELMMATFVRRRAAFLSARDLLSPEHLERRDPGFAVVWASVVDFEKEWERLPKQFELENDVHARLRADRDALDDDERARLFRFIKRAFALPAEDLSDQLALQTLRLYLEDNLYAKAREHFQLGDETPKDVFGFMTDLSEEAAKVSSVQTAGVGPAFPEEWTNDYDGLEIWPTGLDVFDYFLAGGHVPGEAHGIIGPWGVCKTLLAVMIACEAARSSYRRWEKNGKQGLVPYSYLFFYESKIEEIRIRALSYLGQIDKEALEVGRWKQTLSRSHNLKPYEKKWWGHIRALGHRIPGEWDRLKWAKQALNRNLRLVDMTGADKENPGRGNGLCPEIAAIIREDQRIREDALLVPPAERKPSVCCLTVDWVGAAVEQWIAATNKDREKVYRDKVVQFPRSAVREVGTPFHCPVWLFHQLTTQAQGMSAGIIPKVTDSAEARAFPQYCDHFFTIGGKDKQLSMCVIAPVKGRRLKIKKETILFIDGRYAAVRDVGLKYALHPTVKRIVSVKDLRTVRAGDKRDRDSEESVMEDTAMARG